MSTKKFPGHSSPPPVPRKAELRLHHLKTWPEYYNAIRDRTKTFELRKNDRGFKVGDILALQEYNPKSQSYTGNNQYREVTYILEGGQFGLEEGVCILGLKDAFN